MKLTAFLLVVGLGGLFVLHRAQIKEISPPKTDLYAKAVRAKNMMKPVTESRLGNCGASDSENSGIKFTCNQLRYSPVGFHLRIHPTMKVELSSTTTNFASVSGQAKVTTSRDQVTVTGLNVTMINEFNVYGRNVFWKDENGKEYRCIPGDPGKLTAVHGKIVKTVVFSVGIKMRWENETVKVQALPTNRTVAGESLAVDIPGDFRFDSFTHFCRLARTTFDEFDNWIVKTQNEFMDHVAKLIQDLLRDSDEGETTGDDVLPRPIGNSSGWYSEEKSAP